MKENEIIENYIRSKNCSIDSIIKDFSELNQIEKSQVLYALIGKSMFKECPVDIKIFLEDPYFLGDIYGKTILPYWKKMLFEVYSTPFTRNYDKVILSGATRIGRTSFIIVSLLYEIYLLTCMKNLSKTLQVPNVVISVLSSNASYAVEGVAFGIYQGLIQSPCFNEIRKKELPFSQVHSIGMHITDSIILKAGSSLDTIRGTNLYAGCFDDVNSSSLGIVKECISEEKNRSNATFGSNKGIFILSSAPLDENDNLANIIKDTNPLEVLIKDNISRWEVREEEVGETFDLYTGSKTEDPCILTEENPHVFSYLEWKERVIHVPVRYLSDAKEDPYMFIRNVAGRRINKR